MGRYQTFVIRIWVDTAEESPHGLIQQVATGRSTYFRDMHKMMQFINGQLGALPLPSNNSDTTPMDEFMEAVGGDAGDR